MQDLEVDWTNSPNKKLAFITGATSGIGLAIAKKLANSHTVVGIGRDPVRRREFLNIGPFAQIAYGDVRHANTFENIFNRYETADFPVKTLVYSAGVGLSRSAMDHSEEDIKDIFDVNVLGAMRFIKAGLPHMIRSGGGQIILISSTAGIYGYKYNSAYSATKHALCGLAKSLAKEQGKHGICCVCLCPGITDTPMTDKMIGGLSENRMITLSQAKDIVSKTNPQNRIIDPNEIAEMANLIASGLVPSLSGSCILMGAGE